MNRYLSFLAAAAAAMMTFGAIAAGSGPVPPQAKDSNWYSHNGSVQENNYSRLDQINAKTVDRLGLAWSLDLVGEVSLEATPLAIDGKLYFTGSSSDVYAVDALSGRILWKYDPEIWKYRPDQEHMKLLWGINRGAAYSDGKVFVGTLDGRLIALNAGTGALIWSVKTVPEPSLYTISGAPWAIKGKVLIGNGGADFGARGFVTAYDQETGKQAWRFYTTPGDPAKNYEADPQEHDAMEMAAKTWGGEWWKVGGGGGTVWDNMTYDPELNQIYIGVGNSGPWNPRVRNPGPSKSGNLDNLFNASIVALNADTGKYVWHYQANPQESWDFKSTSNMISADLTIDGKSRQVLMQSPTNGFFYVIDRTNGRLISAEKVGKVTWADHIDIKTGRPVEVPNVRYEKGQLQIWPSAVGGHNWQGMAYSPQSGLAYIPVLQLGSRISDEHNPPPPNSNQFPFHFGGVFVELIAPDPEDGKGTLVAWDPVTEKARWKVPRPSIWNGGVMATAGGLIFQGTADGQLFAYDAVSGKQVWVFDVKHGIIASPITYTVAGKQYISILSGYGGTIAPLSNFANRGWKFGAQPRRLLTFALDAKGVLPPTAPRDFKVHALDDPKLQIDPAKAKAGLAVYQINCQYCHGKLLLSAGTPAPDLRESPVALNYQAFHTVVKDGTLLPKLMPRFEKLSEQDVEDVYAYIRSGAREALTSPTQ